MENKKKLPTMSRLGIIFLAWRRYLEKTASSNDLTLNQYYILRQLVKKDFLNPSEIAEQLFCDRPTATVIIDNLKKYGFVTKEKDPEDGKRIRVKITEKGIKQVNITEEAFERMNKFDPLSCFTHEEKESLEALLIKLHEHIKQIR